MAIAEVVRKVLFCIYLMSESRGFPDRLAEECEDKRGVKNEFNMFDPNSGNDVLLSNKMEKTTG